MGGGDVMTDISDGGPYKKTVGNANFLAVCSR